MYGEFTGRREIRIVRVGYSLKKLKILPWTINIGEQLSLQTSKEVIFNGYMCFYLIINKIKEQEDLTNSMETLFSVMDKDLSTYLLFASAEWQPSELLWHRLPALTPAFQPSPEISGGRTVTPARERKCNHAGSLWKWQIHIWAPSVYLENTNCLHVCCLNGRCD